MKTEFTGGVGFSSIIKTAEKYDGEYDFKNDNGVFVFRLILHILLQWNGRLNAVFGRFMLRQAVY